MCVCIIQIRVETIHSFETSLLLDLMDLAKLLGDGGTLRVSHYTATAGFWEFLRASPM